MRSIIFTLLTVILTQISPTRAAENISPTVTLRALFDTNKTVTIGTFPVPSFAIEAEDPDGTVATVKLFQSNIEIASHDGPSYAYGPDYRRGFNDFYAVAYDNSQAAATSAVIRILATLAPTVQMLEPQSSVAFFALSDSLIVKGTATDADGLEQVRLLVNGKVVASDFAAPYEFVFQGTTYTNYNLQLEAIDTVGGTARTEVRRVEYVRVDDNLTGNIQVHFGTNQYLKSSNLEATLQKGEPQHAGVPGGKSVWFAWRPFSGGNVIVDTFGSQFDTVLAVYTNRSLQLGAISNLVEIASNDNDAPDQPYSRVKFPVQSGTVYYIAVDGRDGVAGEIELNIRFSPSRGPQHDFLVNAIRLASSSQHLSSNVGGSREPGEPDHAGNHGGASVWYRLDASIFPQGLRITTDGSSFDTTLAIYTNVVVQPRQLVPNMEDLRLVAENDDSPYGTNRTSTIILGGGFPTFSTYWIAVDGYNGAEGPLRISVAPYTPTFVPNDRFASATRLVGTAALTNVNTSRATSESGDPLTALAGISARSVWYRWTAPSNGPVYLSTKFSDFDTVMGVYTGTNILNLDQVAVNDDDPSGARTSAIVFNAIAGVEYRIGIAGYQGAYGDVVFALNQAAFYAPRILTQPFQGRLIFNIADASGSVLLERSSDLANWVAVEVVDTDEQPIELTPDPALPQQFYRVRTIQ